MKNLVVFLLLILFSTSVFAKRSNNIVKNFKQMYSIVESLENQEFFSFTATEEEKNGLIYIQINPKNLMKINNKLSASENAEFFYLFTFEAETNEFLEMKKIIRENNNR